MRQRPDSLILIAVYEFVMAAMFLIASCVVLPIALLITPFASHGFGQFVARFFFVALALTVVFGFGVASAVVGFGLLTLKEWARIGAMLLAIPVLVIFPIWTVIGILILVYLAGEEGRSLFRHSRRASKVSARTYREEAEVPAEESSDSPPNWTSSDIPHFDPEDDGGPIIVPASRDGDDTVIVRHGPVPDDETITVRDVPSDEESTLAREEGGEPVSWVEPATDVNGHESTDDDDKSPVDRTPR